MITDAIKKVNFYTLSDAKLDFSSYYNYEIIK